MRGESDDTLALYTAHRGALVKFASRILGDRGHAEDVVQEAYLRFDAAAGAGTPMEPVAYLYRIVRNLALDVRRRLMRDRARMVGDGAAMLDDLAEDRPSPEAHAVSRDEIRLMRDAMAELPDRTRLALELHRFAGWTFQDIAGHLGVSVGTAHGLVVQGLDHCRRRLFRA